MTFQFKDVAIDNAPARSSATNHTMALLALRLGMLLPLQFKDVVRHNALPGRGTTNRTIVLLALCLGVLVAQIDTSVVNLATHAIGATFRAGVAPLQWVLDAYNLVYAVLLLSGGLVADLYGRRRAFAIGAAVMTAGSLVCAFAPSIGVLIGGRAMTGVGAALLLPSSLAIIRVVWPEPAARGRTLGIWASCNGLAFAIGPSIGGFLIGHFGCAACSCWWCRWPPLPSHWRGWPCRSRPIPKAGISIYLAKYPALSHWAAWHLPRSPAMTAATNGSPPCCSPRWRCRCSSGPNASAAPRRWCRSTCSGSAPSAAPSSRRRR
jgi:MFS family permease